MNTARIVVLVIAVAAGGVAVMLASRSGNPPPVAVVPEARPTVDVLVAKTNIDLGATLKGENFEWQAWPSTSTNSNFITRGSNPEAIREYEGSIARSPFVAGEPIRAVKLVKLDGSGFMAAILPAGMRAVSTEISPETGAGGFILPNDRVDVILTHRENGNDDDDKKVHARGGAEIILSNVRVLAVDQTIEDKDGQKVVIGKTATLELTAGQSETLAFARQNGTLSLALRSLSDARAKDQKSESRGAIDIVRFGVTTRSAIK